MARAASGARSKKTPAKPEPLIPEDCDLRDIPAMMLQRSIFTSELVALSTGDEFKAALVLYDAAYGQLPSGSLPKDDRSLAYLSRAGSDWPNVKEIALRGWIECSDGRLYHPITAEKALLAWIGRLRQRHASRAGGAAKNRPGEQFDAGGIPGQIDTAMAHLARLVPESREVKAWRGRRGGAAPAPGADIIPLGKMA